MKPGLRWLASEAVERDSIVILVAKIVLIRNSSLSPTLSTISLVLSCLSRNCPV